MRTRTLVFVGSATTALLAAGCATQSERSVAASDPYYAAVYTGAPRPDAADLYAVLEPPRQTSSNGTPFELVSYAGIDGARRAHALYAEAEAEALDGRCEAEVRAAASESMIDVAELCDVPLDILVEFNPGVANVSYEVSGAALRIPGGIVAPKGAFAMSDQLVLLNSFQPGDTIENIAYRNNVSAATIASLNPTIDWSAPNLSGAYLTPASTSTSAAVAPAETAAWEGYSPIGAADANAPYSGIAGDAAHAPYRQKLVGTYARADGYYPEPRLVVDKRFVKPGDKIGVTAYGVGAGKEIVFSAGGKSMSATAGSDGNASASIRVGKKTPTSNVVVTGRARGSADTMFSETVGVVALGAKPEETDEATEDDD